MTVAAKVTVATMFVIQEFFEALTSLDLAKANSVLANSGKRLAKAYDEGFNSVKKARTEEEAAAAAAEQSALEEKKAQEAAAAASAKKNKTTKDNNTDR